MQVCATLSGIPSNGLECDIVVQLMTSPALADQGKDNLYTVHIIKHTYMHAAFEGDDFSPSGDLRIVFDSSLNGATATRCTQILLSDDDILERSEFFNVEISSLTPSIVALPSPALVVVEIQDTDSSKNLWLL